MPAVRSVCGSDMMEPATCAQAPLIFQRVREAFPDANVFASTFDDYTHALVAAAPDLDLPIVTQEIGDTWIYGEAAGYASGPYTAWGKPPCCWVLPRPQVGRVCLLQLGDVMGVQVLHACLVLKGHALLTS